MIGLLAFPLLGSLILLAVRTGFVGGLRLVPLPLLFRGLFVLVLVGGLLLT